jgi:hypothetical protein
MPCPSDAYGGGRAEDRFWHNWLRNISYFVPSYFEPASRQDLVWILQQAEAQHKRVKAVGRGWSFEDCAVSEDWVIDLGRLQNTITFLTHPATGPALLSPAWAQRQFGPSTEKLYHVEAGITIFKLNQQLHSEQLAMLTLGGSQGQTLAGAISTSTHGSDLDQLPLPGVIQAIHLVTTGGQEVWIESASEPLTRNDAALLATLACPDLQIVRDDELLRAAMVTVGRFGVVYAYVIKVAPLFRLSEWTADVSWDAVAAALTAGVGLGSGVPVRRHLGGLAGLLPDPPANLDIGPTVGDFRFLDILLSANVRLTHGDAGCWVRRRWLTNNAQDVNLESGANFLCLPGVANAVLTAAGAALGAYASHVVAIPFYGAVKAIEIGIDAARLNALAHDPGISGGEALVESLNAIWRAQIGNELEGLIAELNQILLARGLSKSRGDGKRGPGWQVAVGLEERGDDACYRANSIELIFDTQTTAYIDYINTLLDNAHQFHIGGYISIRFSSRSRAYLSMHNVGSPLAVSIEVASLHGFEGNDGWIGFAEHTAKAMGGRPHWGQQNQLSAHDVLALYGLDNLENWSHQCFRMVGPTSQTFSNRYTRQRGLEPLRRPATAFAMVSPALLDLGRVLEHTRVVRDHGLTVSNVGTGSLAIQRVRLAGPQAAAFTVTPHARALPLILQRGESFPVSLQFQSAAAGEHEARVEITSLDHRSGSETTIHAVLTADVVGPDMSVLPAAIDFGIVPAGQAIQRNVLVINNGSATLRFRVPPPASGSVFEWTGDAPLHWRTVPAGGAEAIAVHYKPVATGRHAAEIRIVSERQSATVPLFGERAPASVPHIQVVPQHLDFGMVAIGTAATGQLVLANDSTAALIIRGARVEGPDMAQFALAGEALGVVRAGQTALLSVNYVPAVGAAGAHQATLIIDSNAANAPALSVNLSGAAAGGAGWLEPMLAMMMR